MPENMNDIEGLMIRFLHEDISENELRELDHWLQESPENKESFFQLKNTFDSIKNHKLLSEEEIEKSWQRMQQKMQESKEIMPASSGKRFFMHSLRYIAVAIVAIALGTGIGIYIETYTPNQSAEEENLVEFNEIQVKKGGTPSIITLSDGSIVSLNASTTFRYPTTFSKTFREVYLDGEAFFEVAPNEAIPFVVKLKQQSITVHGTSFNVEAYHNASYSIITLINGSISLETLNKSGVKISSILLQPGQKAYFDSSSELVSLEKSDNSLAKEWLNGSFKFKDEPLEIITKRLENYYGVNIYLDDESLKHIRYTGSFSIEQGIQQILHIINGEKQFLFQQTGNDIHIKKK
ncbi:anti-sigma factor [Bacteroidia bacterium]|nr:anti-sigma factor [Bacteroidia bacterium]